MKYTIDIHALFDLIGYLVFIVQLLFLGACVGYWKGTHAHNSKGHAKAKTKRKRAAKPKRIVAAKGLTPAAQLQ